MANGGAAYNRRKETQYWQNQTRKKGTLSPRGLARSIVRGINRKNSCKENDMDMWRSKVKEEWAKMKMMPKRKLRKLQKEA